MRNTGLDKAQAGIKIAGRNINDLRYEDDTNLMTESEEELKSLLMKMKEESEKADIWSLHFMADRWGNNGNSERFYFWGAPKSLQMVTAAMKSRCLFLGRKATTNLDGRDITLPTKVHLVKAMVFPVVTYGCES